MCVLVVEDDRTLGTLFLKHLATLGYRADLVVDGEQAIKHVEQNGYGLVLMDIGLPGKDGLTTASEIRQMGQDSEQLPIVGITCGHASRQECLAAGMNDYMEKPVLLDQLRGLLKKWQATPCKPPEE